MYATIQNNVKADTLTVRVGHLVAMVSNHVSCCSRERPCSSLICI